MGCFLVWYYWTVDDECLYVYTLQEPTYSGLLALFFRFLAQAVHRLSMIQTFVSYD